VSILRSPVGIAGLMAVLTLALLLPWLGAAPFDDPGEGQHAEIAREVAASGDWLTLRLAGVRYFDKPPLLYWLIAAGFKGFGVSEWAARLPAALAAAAAVAGTTLLGARLLSPGPGVLAGAALLSCALFAAFGRYVRPETLFVAAIQWGFTGLLLAVAPYWSWGGAAPLLPPTPPPPH
jgi:4-amino-4-deoxy-L-arabinose transferase-like glycosyltransferase